MSRFWIAVIATALAVAVLAALIFNSRGVSVNDFDAHYQTVNELDQSVANYESLMDQLSAARRDGRAVGSGVTLMRTLLADNEDAIKAVVSTGEIATSQAAFTNTLDNVLEQSLLVETRQNTVGSSLKYIRENGPVEVQNLKANGFEIESRAFYKLLLKTLAFATPGNGDAEQIQQTVSALKDNGDLLGSSMVSMIDAIERLLESRTAADQAWNELEKSNFAQNAVNLRNKFSRSHAERVTKKDNSQTLLSIFSVLLFGGLGVMGVRLQGSYSEINEVNEQLVDVNSGLESRVLERTSELEKAFDELKESQVQLVQAEKMSSLGQLVAGISHEINTPLLYLQSNQTLIKETLVRVDSFIDLCHDKLVPRASPLEAKEVVRQRYVKGLQQLKATLLEEEIKADIEELMELTSDNMEGLEELTIMAQGLKDFSRLDRAPIDSFNVNDGVKRTLVIAKNMLKNKVNVVQELGEVPAVRCSPSQINQIFLNLITNAAQSMEDGGDITISTSSENGYVQVAVKDEGCGIPDEIMSKIRDPFFTTKEVGSGTGLGLSICEEILRSHNGRLDIQTEVGKGSVFTVLLPHKVSNPALLEDQEGASLDSDIDYELPALSAVKPDEPANAGESDSKGLALVG